MYVHTEISSGLVLENYCEGPDDQEDNEVAIYNIMAVNLKGC